MERGRIIRNAPPLLAVLFRAIPNIMFLLSRHPWSLCLPSFYSFREQEIHGVYYASHTES